MEKIPLTRAGHSALNDELKRLKSEERPAVIRAIAEARNFEGPAEDRILGLMENVMTYNMARYDLPIWHWAQTDINAKRVFKRALKKRFGHFDNVAGNKKFAILRATQKV